MAFLKRRVSPEPLCPSTMEGETELSNSLPLHEKSTDNFNPDEDKETPTIDYRGAKECQEGLDGIPEEELYNGPSSVNQNEKLSARSHSPKRNSWSNPEEINSSRRHHGCDRIIVLAVCLMSAASFLLTLLMLFGIVAPLNCACSGETESQSTKLKDMLNELKATAKETADLTNKLKNATDRLDREDNALRAVLKEINMTFSIKVDNVRKLLGPIGPPGFNGSQGPIGPGGPPGFNGTQGPRGIVGPQGINGSEGAPDSTGPQGSQGAGNFSQCVHKTSSNSGSQNKVTSNIRVGSITVAVEERSDKRIMGATCSTDLAQKYLLSTALNPGNGHLYYYCKCYGHYGSGSQTVKCTIHYWECPLTT